MDNVVRFSAADRDIIRKHVIGKPTGVIATIGGMKFDLIPITAEQAQTLFEILDVVGPMWAQGDVTGGKSDLMMILGREGKRTMDVLRSVVHDAAEANGLIDADGGEEIFAEWFGKLPPVETLQTLFPKFVEAQGLKTLLGNGSPPPANETAGEATSP
jgi:hypothetical protein